MTLLLNRIAMIDNKNNENTARFQTVPNKPLYNKAEFPERKEGEDYLDYLGRIAKWGTEQRKAQEKEIPEEQPANDGGKNNEHNINFMKRDRYYKVLITVFLIYIMAMLYLFVLNGRYTSAGDAYVFDKWKRELLVPNHEPFKF